MPRPWKPPTLEALWRAPGEDVAIVPGTADFGPGHVRLTFLVIDGQGRVVTRPTARVWLARGPEGAAVRGDDRRVGADRRPRTPPSPARRRTIFVTHLQLDEARQVLGPGRAGRRPEDPGGRNRRRQEQDRRAGRRRGCGRLEDPHARDRDARPADDVDDAGSGSSTAARSPMRSGRRSPSSSSSRRRSTARAAPAARSWTSSARSAAGTRSRASPSSMSRSTRTTIPRRARTSGCGSGGFRPSRGSSSSAPDGKVRERFEGTVSVAELDAAVDRLE